VSPVGALLAESFRALGMTDHAGGTLRHGLWWFHGLIALLFIALIPATKVKHIFTAAASLMVRDPLAAQRLPRIPESQAQRASERSPTSTGSSCLTSMPAPSAGAVMKPAPPVPWAPPCLRATSFESARVRPATLESGKIPQAAELDVHGKAPGQVAQETLWSCRTCMACVEICPVAVEHVPSSCRCGASSSRTAPWTRF